MTEMLFEQAAQHRARGYGGDARERMAFFTDTTVCIGCKACEVACKEWNYVPENLLEWTGESYDNTSQLNSDNWRHVAFIEQRLPEPSFPDSNLFELPLREPDGQGEFRWLMNSDVCKHCTTAGCLDVCPTGSIFRTEFDTVVIQDDICNGCGYCVVACPYGVITIRQGDGRAWKCTLCYDRLLDDMEPACAKACPTDSINFGTLEKMQRIAEDRLDRVVAAGFQGARLYGDGPSQGVDGTGSIFLLLDEPEVYGLPPDPVVTTKHLPEMWKSAGMAMAGLAALVGVALGGGRR
jgi:formate dehydrogenase iron-sulfur subunit